MFVVSMLTEMLQILNKPPNNITICVRGERDDNDDDDDGARTHYQCCGDTCAHAHVDFFMPIHLQKQSQLKSQLLVITAELFFIYVFPHFECVIVQLMDREE